MVFLPRKDIGSLYAMALRALSALAILGYTVCARAAEVSLDDYSKYVRYPTFHVIAFANSDYGTGPDGKDLSLKSGLADHQAIKEAFERFRQAAPGCDASDPCDPSDIRSFSYKTSWFEFEENRQFETVKDFFDKIRTYATENIKNGDVVVFYYSGHGFVYNHNTYIVPTKSDFLFEDSQVLQSDAIDIKRIARVLNAHTRGVNLFILDSCRKGLEFRVGDEPTTSAPATELGGQTGVDGFIIPTQIIYPNAIGGQTFGWSSPDQVSVFTRAIHDTLIKILNSEDETSTIGTYLSKLFVIFEWLKDSVDPDGKLYPEEAGSIGVGQFGATPLLPSHDQWDAIKRTWNEALDEEDARRQRTIIRILYKSTRWTQFGEAAEKYLQDTRATVVPDLIAVARGEQVVPVAFRGDLGEMMLSTNAIDKAFDPVKKGKFAGIARSNLEVRFPRSLPYSTLSNELPAEDFGIFYGDTESEVKANFQEIIDARQVFQKLNNQFRAAGQLTITADTSLLASPDTGADTIGTLPGSTTVVIDGFAPPTQNRPYSEVFSAPVPDRFFAEVELGALPYGFPQTSRTMTVGTVADTPDAAGNKVWLEARVDKQFPTGGPDVQIIGRIYEELEIDVADETLGLRFETAKLEKMLETMRREDRKLAWVSIALPPFPEAPETASETEKAVKLEREADLQFLRQQQLRMFFRNAGFEDFRTNKMSFVTADPSVSKDAGRIRLFVY